MPVDAAAAADGLPTEPRAAAALAGDGVRPERGGGAPLELRTPATILGVRGALCLARRECTRRSRRRSTRAQRRLDGEVADALNFTIFGQPGAALVVSAVQPLGAVAGGTRVVVHGEGFLDLGDARLLGRLGSVQAG